MKRQPAFQAGPLAINAYNKAIQFDTEFGWPYSGQHVAQSNTAILLYERIEL
jgi:hypothetical protein